MEEAAAASRTAIFDNSGLRKEDQVPKTRFKPQIDGFAFTNYWTYDQAETDKINQILASVIDGIILTIVPMVAPVPDPITLAITTAIVGPKIAGLIQGALPSDYGLCGGMAWTALDYFKAGWVVPRGAGYSDQPKRPDAGGTDAGAVLRNYFWQRLVDSDTEGGAAATALEWMAILFFVPKGAAILRNRSMAEWAKLKSHLDLGEPWPLVLIGTTSNPMHNHQVLATGYDDPGDGTGTLYLYDNVCPDSETVIKLDFRDGQAFATENAAAPKVYAFAVSKDQRLLANYQDSAGWHWGDLGFPLNTTVNTASPAAISYREANVERIYCFVRGADARLHVNFWDGAQWHWADQGVPPNSWVSELGIGACTYNQAGIQKIYCFTAGLNDSSLYVNYWDGTAWHWANQGVPPNTVVASTPSVITFEEGEIQRIYVFMIGLDGHLHVNFWDGAQWRWADEGTPPNTISVRYCTAVARTGADLQKIEVFMWASDDHLYDYAWDGATWQWIDIGPSPNGAGKQPSVIAHVNDFGIQATWVFFTAANGHLEVAYFDGSQWAWVDLGTPPNQTLSGPPAAVLYQEGGVTLAHVFAVCGISGRVFRCFWNGGKWIWEDQGTDPWNSLFSYYAPGVISYSDCGCASTQRGPLQGFFCGNYSFSLPPVAVGVSQGLSVTGTAPIHDGNRLQVSLAAHNYSYCASPRLSLYVAGRPLANPTEVQDAGGEANPASLAIGASRILTESTVLQGTLGTREFVAVCHLGVYDGVDVWRSLPAVEPNTNAAVSIQVS